MIVSNPAREDATLPAVDPAPHPPGLQPVVTEVPMGSAAVDCAFDPARQRLYVSRANQVDSYDPSTRQLSPLINLATAVGRMDLSADGSRLLVTLPGANSLGVIDLTASPPTSTSVLLPSGPPGTGSQRPFDVVGLSNGKALISCGVSGDCTTLLREVKLATLTPPESARR
ncbi:hypothetical protein IV102_32000 [bacterium]|nr:hypothetical protein [bacterium]